MAFPNGAGYAEWSREVSSVLESQGLYEIATGDEQAPVGQPQAFADYKLLSARAREAILSSMEDGILKRQLMEVSDPAEIWELVQEECDTSGHLTEFERRFYSLRPFEGERDSVYCRRLDMYHKPLENTDHDILDEDLIEHLFATVAPKSYHIMVQLHDDEFGRDTRWVARRLAYYIPSALNLLGPSPTSAALNDFDILVHPPPPPLAFCTHPIRPFIHALVPTDYHRSPTVIGN